MGDVEGGRKEPLAGILLTLPDSQLDAVVKPMVMRWADPPTALQILEVLDLCIHDALASDLVVTALQHAYGKACDAEDTTHDAVALKATWRGADGFR